MKTPYLIIICILTGLSTFQIVSIITLKEQLEIAQAKSDAALQVAMDARLLAFEAKRIAEAKQAPTPPTSCNPENGVCHSRPYTYKDFMGGKQ